MQEQCCCLNRKLSNISFNRSTLDADSNNLIVVLVANGNKKPTKRPPIGFGNLRKCRLPMRALFDFACFYPHSVSLLRLSDYRLLVIIAGTNGRHLH